MDLCTEHFIIAMRALAVGQTSVVATVGLRGRGFRAPMACSSFPERNI